MASNCFGSEPIQKAKRWDRKGKKEVSVDIPYVVHKYNTSMGCINRQDQNVNKYKISIRTKKWWWPLFSFIFLFCDEKIDYDYYMLLQQNL